MQARGTDFVLYEVSDIDRSISFYRDILGLKLEFYTGDVPWAEFSAPPTTLALFDPSKHRSEAPEPRIGGASIHLAVEDIDAAVSELEEKGVPIAYGPMESPVCQMAGILDPDGNLVGLHQRKDGTFG